MKFMLMMHARELLPAEDMKASIDHMVRLNNELDESGELILTEGLASPDRATLVTNRGDGAYAVTDGPFAEAKEFLIGFWLVDCDSKARAHEIAAQISAVPGVGGLPANMPIEVREVMG